MLTYGLYHLVATAIHRIEGGHWLLEDHRDLVTAIVPYLLLGELDEVDRVAAIGGVVPYLAPGNTTRRYRQQPHHAERGHRLTRAALTHNTYRLTPV